MIVAVVRLAAGLPLAAVALPPGVAAPAGLVAAVGILAAPWIVRRVRNRRATSRRDGARPSGARTPTAARKPARGDQLDRGLTTAQRWVVIAAALVVGVSSIAVGDAATRVTRLVMLDVGQGDAILRREPRRRADAGGRRT